MLLFARLALGAERPRQDYSNPFGSATARKLTA
jgi:hypothetical protein